MITLTGRTKIDFEKWFRENIMGPRNYHFKVDTSNKRNGTKLLWLGLEDFYSLPESMQEGVYYKFFGYMSDAPIIKVSLKALLKKYEQGI